MKRCVCLVRCSTDKEKGLQDYQYQIDTLKEMCDKRGWEIVKIFGMEITFVTSAQTDEEAYALLSKFGLPFKNAKKN